MKVLLISPTPPPAGGIASWTARVLQIGLPRNWEIVHINSNMIGGRDPFKNIKISFKDEAIRSINIWKKELEALKDKDIKVVHTCIPCTLFGMLRETVTGIIAKMNGKKFILHCRCTVPNVVNTSVKKMVFRMLGKFCDSIIVLNQKSKVFAERNTKSYVILIPNFVADSEFIDLSERDYNKFIDIAYVGGVTAEKGCDIIIQAAKSLPGLTFHMVGNPSVELSEIQKPNNVIFYGNKDKEFVQNILRKADAFLFLSRFWGEGFSNSLVEAMSAGLPCIVSDWAANADMIDSDGGSVVVECTPNRLAEELQKMLDSPIQREKMGRRNAEKARIDYSENVVLNAYVDTYNSIIMQKSSNCLL